jgi:ubiquinone/menaquinone biosynthesis C-methylase UbiE
MNIFEQVQLGYDQIVLEYAKRNHSTMAENLVFLAQELIQHVGTEGHILDIGCGTGRDMAWFESQKVNVLGIDLSMGMLKYAQASVQGNLISMNMRNLGFSTAIFDGVWCCASLLHLPKSEAIFALQETHRILKAGGMLVLSVQEGIGEQWEESYVPNVKRFFARYQVSEMKDLLSSNGFSVCRSGSSNEAQRNWLSFVCLAN